MNEAVKKRQNACLARCFRLLFISGREDNQPAKPKVNKMSNIRYNIKSTSKTGYVSYVRQGSTMAWTFEECMKIVTTLSGDDRYMGVLFEIELA
ncbi:exonuclease [Klebsiella phage KNP2]|nr:exonuclease [Klebsiella phage KNP2]